MTRLVAPVATAAALAGLHASAGALSATASGDPVVLAFEWLRRGAIGAGWYLVIVTALATVARAVRSPALAGAVRSVTVPGLRTAVERMAGATVAIALTGAPVGDTHATDVPVLQRIEETAPSHGDTAPSSGDTTPSHGDAGARQVAGAAPPVTAGEKAATWTVEPGDHFWSIAERVLTEHAGRSITDREIAPFWLRLIDANRSRLANPADADLLFPGQVLDVPDPEPTVR